MNFTLEILKALGVDFESAGDTFLDQLLAWTQNINVESIVTSIETVRDKILDTIDIVFGDGTVSEKLLRLADLFDFTFLEDFFSHVDRMTIEALNSYIREVLKPARLVEIIIGPEGN